MTKPAPVRPLTSLLESLEEAVADISQDHLMHLF